MLGIITTILTMLMLFAADWSAANTVKMCRATANTSTGSQNITCAGFTETPTFVWLTLVGAAEDSQADGARLSYGMSDCTNQWGVGMFGADAQSLMVNKHWADDGSILVGPNSSGLEFQAAVTACISGGVTINWSNAPPSAWSITAVFIEGTDYSADVGVANSPDVGSTTDVVTGFEPDLVLLTRTPSTVPTNAFRNTFALFAGMAARDGLQRTVNFWADDAVSTEAVQTVMMSDRTMHRFTNDRGVSVSFNSDGFRFTPIVKNLPGIGYAALRLNGGLRNVEDVVTPSGTGAQTHTTGFQPTLLVQMLTTHSSSEGLGSGSNDPTDGTNNGVLGFAITTADGTFTNAVHIQDGVGTSNTLSWSATGVEMRDNTGVIAAATTALISDGYSNTFSTVPGEQRRWLTYAIGGEVQAAPATSIANTVIYYD